jgi:putative ABC transport system permease protein
VADTRFSVIGRITGSTDDTLANAVVIPHSAALAIDGVSDFQTVVLVRTDLGGGGPVSRVIRIAIRPDRPESLATSPVADFSSLRQGVGSELTRLTAAVGFLLLAVATLLIANAMIVSVVSRTAEIGLRRSMGASQRGIARIFFIEGGLLGVLGGLLGSASGMAVSLAIAAMNRWDTTQPLLAVFVGPAVGLAAGLLASAYPSWRAATTLPAEAMRAD